MSIKSVNPKVVINVKVPSIAVPDREATVRLTEYQGQGVFHVWSNVPGRCVVEVFVADYIHHNNTVLKGSAPPSVYNKARILALLSALEAFKEEMQYLYDEYAKAVETEYGKVADSIGWRSVSSSEYRKTMVEFEVGQKMTHHLEHSVLISKDAEFRECGKIVYSAKQQDTKPPYYYVREGIYVA